jgi:hypothetical protein
MIYYLLTCALFGAYVYIKVLDDEEERPRIFMTMIAVIAMPIVVGHIIVELIKQLNNKE